jgi:hypothetical protein
LPDWQDCQICKIFRLPDWQDLKDFFKIKDSRFEDLKIQSGNLAISKLENSIDSITTLSIADCRLPIEKKFLYPAGRG